MKDLNFTLITLVREAESIGEKAVQDLHTSANKYSLTSSQILQEMEKAKGVVQARILDIKKQGFEAIEERCAELDKADTSRMEARFHDINYLQRLAAKLGIMREIDTKNADVDILRAFLYEYDMDPLAAAAFEPVIDDPMRFSSLIRMKDENGGTPQEHLRTAVRSSFEIAVNAASDPLDASKAKDGSAALYDLSGGNKAVFDGFCEYCRMQNADFSRSDREIWEEKRKGSKGQEDPAAAVFNFNFKPVSELNKNH